MRNAILICCLVSFVSGTSAAEPSDTAAALGEARAAVESAHAREQEAFIKGDCPTMASFYSKDVTFYANGRVLPSVAALIGLCERIPRPFEQSAAMNDSIQVLSETAAYVVRVLEFPPQEDSNLQKREVVTKVWSKGPQGWKIVHFQSSITMVADQ